jgi:hypothetical protein
MASAVSMVTISRSSPNKFGSISGASWGPGWPAGPSPGCWGVVARTGSCTRLPVLAWSAGDAVRRPRSAGCPELPGPGATHGRDQLGVVVVGGWNGSCRRVGDPGRFAPTPGRSAAASGTTRCVPITMGSSPTKRHPGRSAIATRLRPVLLRRHRGKPSRADQRWSQAAVQRLSCAGIG